MRRYRQFGWKDSTFRICTTEFAAATAEIVQQRGELECYISRHAAFRTALEPVPLLPAAPLSARRMAAAAALTGVGPMAAVAGALAQLAAEAAVRAGASEAVVDNGGDVYLVSDRTVLVGLFSGPGSPIKDRLAFAVSPAAMPLAICSSSARLGHSKSFGDCDLATVTARDAALAAAAATLACNLVRSVADMDSALARVQSIRGVAGVLLVKAGRVGLAGALPALVRNRDTDTEHKITRHRRTW